MLSTLRQLFSRPKPKVEYFLVENSPSESPDFPVYAERESGVGGNFSWTLGKPIPTPVSEPIIYEQENPAELEDFLRTVTIQFLVSERTLDSVKGMSTCAKAYRAHIVRGSETLSTSYYAVNFERSWSCMDLNRSKFTKSKAGDFINRVSRLVLDVDRIPKNEDVFRLKEFPTFLVASRRFKMAAEQAGLTGMSFVDFRGKHLL